MDAEALRALVDASYADARAVLPSIPTDVRFELDDSGRSPFLIPGYGVGGCAAGRARIVVAVDPRAQVEPDVLAGRVRAGVFHECCHLAQGISNETVDIRTLPLLSYAVHEGCATVFERDRGGGDPAWGRYLDEDTMLEWTRELAALGPRPDITRWVIWDPETKRQWILYRVGTFLVDRAVDRGGCTIEDVVALTPDAVVALAGIECGVSQRST